MQSILPSTETPMTKTEAFEQGRTLALSGAFYDTCKRLAAGIPKDLRPDYVRGFIKGQTEVLFRNEKRKEDKKK
jgi:hypothetical protein